MTPKTRQVMVMKANGMAAKEIAKDLGVHRRTVDWHVRKACAELGAVNAVNAVALAIRDGLILIGEIGCILILCWSGLVGDVDARRGPNPTASRTARREMVV